MADVRKDSQYFKVRLTEANVYNKQRLNGPSTYQTWLEVSDEDEHEYFMDALRSFGPNVPQAFLSFLIAEANSAAGRSQNETKRRLIDFGLVRQ